tara:strand:+ start:122 stop:562 length:441 start_codon:yes stop_codon:yes gene_type:complete
MEFKWYLIRAKVEDHAYLPRMISYIELTYALHEETESNKFVIKNQVIIRLKKPDSAKNYVPYTESLNFENIVYGWAMDAIKTVPDEQILEEKKMKRILNDMMNRQDLEKGATIEEQTVWGYGLEGESGIVKTIDLGTDGSSLPNFD